MNRPGAWALCFALLVGCSQRELALQQPTQVKIGGPETKPTKIDKIALLLVIDNSASMADKQEVLAQAVPDLVGRLIAPRCMGPDATTIAVEQGQPCPHDHPRREFDPIHDIHIGFISSSLGGHGADSCSDVPTASYNPRQDDKAHLITRNSPADPNAIEATWNHRGFLFWDATRPEKYSPPGDKDFEVLTAKMTRIVTGVGQDGCGFESPLEAWYRFLVEPAPYQKMIPYSCATHLPAEGGDCRGPDGVDVVVLQQRNDFLRPDSMLVIVALADENDCSVIDGWQNYIALQGYAGTTAFHLPRATSACMAMPDSPDCMSCAQGDHSDDPGQQPVVLSTEVRASGTRRPDRVEGLLVDRNSLRGSYSEAGSAFAVRASQGPLLPCALRALAASRRVISCCTRTRVARPPPCTWHSATSSCLPPDIDRSASCCRNTPRPPPFPATC